MIDLSDEMIPSSVGEESLDFGFWQQPSSGAEPLRVDRPGSRMRASFSFPAMPADVALRVLPRLKRAMRQGLRVRWPLASVNQGMPGSPVVDGAEPTGTTLPVRGLRPGYVAKCGYVLHIEQAATGKRCFHQLLATVVANGSGEAEFDIEPPLRVPFADGDVIELVRPTIEGRIVGGVASDLNVNHLRYPSTLTIEEA